MNRPADRPTEESIVTIEEALARERMREAERVATQRRAARRLLAARRWRRLAAYAERRAASAGR